MSKGAVTSGHRPITISSVGDVMLARGVNRKFDAGEADFELSEFRKLFATSDIVLANLETPISSRGAPNPRQDPVVTFCASPNTISVLHNMGVTAVTLATNHMLDYGPEALEDTLEHLDAAGISHFGAGRDEEEANRPLIVDVDGQKVALLGSVFIYSVSTKRATPSEPGVADYNIKRLTRTIRSLASQQYRVVISIHWGLEYSFYRLPYLQQQAQAMIDAGADLVLGHGPHYPQGIETYEGRQIVYSPGNFIFDERAYFAKRGFVFTGEIGSPTQNTFSIAPFVLKGCVPTMVSGRSARRFVYFIENLDKIYQRKHREFWKKINNNYFRYIVKIASNARSTRFLFVPPLSFYAGVGLRNYIRKLLGSRI